MKVSKVERDEAIRDLKKLIKKGTTVYTILRHVSNSGMSRRIDLYVIKKNQPYFITGSVGKVLGYRHEYRKGGLVVGGCGMDMGYHLVHDLSRVLFKKDGYDLHHQWL